MTLDEAASVGTYIGNVQLVQGSIEVKAHTLSVVAVQGRLQSMIIEGNANNLAHFTQQTESGGLALGRAKRIEYNASQSRLVLLGQAEMTQGGNHIKSERIDYNTKTNSLVAGNPAPSTGTETTGKTPAERVKIIIKPQNTTGTP